MTTHNLPHQPTTFIGRPDEIADIANRLNDPNCRLLSLVGPGGIGKTRLAIEVASHQLSNFPDGIYFVALQPVMSPDYIVPSIASAIGFEFYDRGELSAQLFHYLHDKCLLLILDNFEHLLAASELVAEILSATRQLKILVTSREGLNLLAEWLYVVEGMSVPQGEHSEEIDAYNAVNLFVERAHRVRHGFSLADERDSVIQVCQLVEGMPLGIELAAAWLKRLPCAEIAGEIERGLDILETDRHGVPPRHRSIRAVFDQSWKLLSEEERQVFLALSVFRGGFQRKAANQVTDASLQILSALVDKSMLRVNNDGRYEIHELQRQYAEERLAKQPTHHAEVRDRHCAYYCEFMNRPIRSFLGEGNAATLQAIDTEIDNVRAAWYWAIEHERVSDLHKAMVGLYWFTWMRSWTHEGEQALRQAVATLRTVQTSEANQIALGRALTLYGVMNIWLGRGVQAREHTQESVNILRPLNAPHEWAAAVSALGWAAFNQHDLTSARPLLLEANSLLEKVGQYELQGFTCGLLGSLARQLGEYEEGDHWYQKALTLGRQIGDQRTVANVLSEYGHAAFRQGEYARARGFFEESLAVAQAGHLAGFVNMALNMLGLVAEALGEFEVAIRYSEAYLTAATEQGNKWAIANALIRLAQVRISMDAYELARQHFQEAMEIALATQNRWFQALVQAGLGRIDFRSGDYRSAQRLYEVSLALNHEIDNRVGVVRNLADLGVVTLKQGDTTQSSSYFRESLQEVIALNEPPLMLIISAGVAELVVQKSKPALGAHLAAFAMNHPASHAETKQQAQHLLQALETEVDIDEFIVACERGSNDTLEVITARLMNALEPPDETLGEPLTDREIEILRLVAAGWSNREIALELTIALGTVKSHLHNILQKLDAQSRTQAVARATELHLL
jgi:predicted ATPase/DNA-binding CsgD family transcriptional regulator/Tfp pilus assembly protein PilF